MEIEHAVAIEHPNVVPVYGAGFERPHFYISMRLISGPDLGHLLHDHGAMPERRALRILGQVGSALHAVHESKLVHRDIKPGNVLLWNAGEEDEHAMLTDFGIAKGLDDPRSITGVGPARPRTWHPRLSCRAQQRPLRTSTHLPAWRSRCCRGGCP